MRRADVYTRTRLKGSPLNQQRLAQKHRKYLTISESTESISFISPPGSTTGQLNQLDLLRANSINTSSSCSMHQRSLHNSNVPMEREAIGLGGAVQSARKLPPLRADKRRNFYFVPSIINIRSSYQRRRRQCEARREITAIFQTRRLMVEIMGIGSSISGSGNRPQQID